MLEYHTRCKAPLILSQHSWFLLDLVVDVVVRRHRCRHRRRHRRRIPTTVAPSPLSSSLSSLSPIARHRHHCCRRCRLSPSSSLSYPIAPPPAAPSPSSSSSPPVATRAVACRAAAVAIVVVVIVVGRRRRRCRRRRSLCRPVALLSPCVVVKWRGAVWYLASVRKKLKSLKHRGRTKTQRKGFLGGV